MDNIKIRPMIKEDSAFIVFANKQVHKASNRENEIIRFEERIINDILSNNPKAYIVVALDNDMPIGMTLYSTTYFADEGQVMWLSNIFVKKEYRNKKIAKLMINYLKDICKIKGYYAICGAVDNNNEVSKVFFDSINSKWLKNFNMFVIK